MIGAHAAIEILKKRDRLEVLAPAVPVGHPLACLARVIEIQHRRHRVDAQRVEVKLLDPVQGVAQQERAHLAAAVVEDQGAPVLVFALPWIGMLVERGAVESREAMQILWKVPRHPVEDHADARAMARVDEVLEVVGSAVTAGRRKEPDHLIAPRSGKGMLHHRQQLDVREAHLACTYGTSVSASSR